MPPLAWLPLLLAAAAAAASAQIIGNSMQLGVKDSSVLCRLLYFDGKPRLAVDFMFCSTDACSRIKIHDADTDGELNYRSLRNCSASGEHCSGVTNTNNVIAPVSKDVYAFLVERRPSEVAVRLLGYPDTQEAKVAVAADNGSFNCTVSTSYRSYVEWVKRSEDMSEIDMVKWMERGERVGIGRDWQGDNSTENGTIVSDRDLLVERRVVWVLWDSGTVGMYYMGLDDKYELKLLSPVSAVAKEHRGVKPYRGPPVRRARRRYSSWHCLRYSPWYTSEPSSESGRTYELYFECHCNTPTLRDNAILGAVRPGSRWLITSNGHRGGGNSDVTIMSDWNSLVSDGKVRAQQAGSDVTYDYPMGLRGEYGLREQLYKDSMKSDEVQFQINDTAACQLQYNEAYRSVLFFACNATACSRLRVTGSDHSGRMAYESSDQCNAYGRGCVPVATEVLPEASPLRAGRWEFIVERNASVLAVRLIGHKTAEYAVVSVPTGSNIVKVKPLKEVDFMPVEFVFRSLNMSGPDMAAWMERGARVQRGQDWDWGQLGSNTGTVLGDRSMILETKSVWVKWDDGLVGLYRMGADNKYDLKLLPVDPAPFKTSTPSLSNLNVLGKIRSPASVVRVNGSDEGRYATILTDWSTFINQGKVQVKWHSSNVSDMVKYYMGFGGKYDFKIAPQKSVSDGDKSSIPIWIPAVILVVLTIITTFFGIRFYQKQRRRYRTHMVFKRGAVNNLNADHTVQDQADLLPFDGRFEFPRRKLRLGRTLGSGAFGVVLQGEAKGIIPGEAVTTVAVKMVKRNTDTVVSQALISELKIMVHLGRHINVVNLLGACTKDYDKHGLLVIVEYCRYGNLHTFLLKHRNLFIDQIDEATGCLDLNRDTRASKVFPIHGRDSPQRFLTYSVTSSSVEHDTSSPSDTSEALFLESGASHHDLDWKSNYVGEYEKELRAISTKDLLCFAFQVARGMEYLASRKVFHGDLAARNILLTDNNIIKICDFGMAKSLYKYENYLKNEQALLPIKWLAIESIRDRIFSIQSDVWSFGIVLWELFSLAETPYTGIAPDQNLYKMLKDGYRMEKPPFASNDLYSLMRECWQVDPSVRPSFPDLISGLGSMLEESVRMHYVQLNDPYVELNQRWLQESGQKDYLTMLSSPTYSNEVPTVKQMPVRYRNIPLGAPPFAAVSTLPQSAASPSLVLRTDVSRISSEGTAAVTLPNHHLVQLPSEHET